MTIGTFGYRLVALLMVFGIGTCASASVVPIDSLPGPLDPTSTLRGFSATQGFQDNAVGFQVASAGTITRITTTLSPDDTGPYSGPFRVGIATSGMIGNPATSPQATPPGSLWEATICSTVTLFPGGPITCNFYPSGDLPRYTLDVGEALDIAVFIVLPAGGTYWFYEWFPNFGSNSWTVNLAEPTISTATRSCGPPNCFDEAASIFFQRTQPAGAPGLRIEFEPTAIPEPPMIALALMGAIALWSGLGRAKRRDAASPGMGTARGSRLNAV